MTANIKHAPGSENHRAARTPEPAQQTLSEALRSHDPAAQVASDESLPPSTCEQASIDDVLDVEGASRMLRVGRNTIYEAVARNEIPHRRLGKQIRFSRTGIVRWLASWSSQGAKERQ